MPLYEYLCESCGERTELLQRFGDLPEVVCPSCGAPMRRLLSAPSFQFKGSGFYQTDYARKPAGGTEGISSRAGADNAADKSSAKGVDKSGDHRAGKAEGPGAASAAGRDSAAGRPAESASPSAPVASGSSADSSRKKPATSGGE